MGEEAENAGDGAENGPDFAETIGRKATRILRGRRGGGAAWGGIGLMGMVGWSVAVPTVAGALAGRWLDGRGTATAGTAADARSWTLVLLAAGLVLGCANAWRWISRENSRSGNTGRGREGDE